MRDSFRIHFLISPPGFETTSITVETGLPFNGMSLCEPRRAFRCRRRCCDCGCSRNFPPRLYTHRTREWAFSFSAGKRSKMVGATGLNLLPVSRFARGYKSQHTKRHPNFSRIGFPTIEPYKLCFFSGSISAGRDDDSAYLIDGVAINGVSGGPVFYLEATEGV